MKKMNNLTISGLKQRKAPTTAAHIRQTGRYYIWTFSEQTESEM